MMLAAESVQRCRCLVHPCPRQIGGYGDSGADGTVDPHAEIK